MTTYIADIDLVGSETERPFMRVYVSGDTADEARAQAARVTDDGEAVRDALTPLQDVLDAVLARPSEWSISWKNEGDAGPVVLTDLAKAPTGVIDVPFGSDPEWEVVLPWSSRAEAKRLARYLGLRLGES